MVDLMSRAYEVAAGELGVHETPGLENTERVLQYHQETSLKASDDETPWCSAFANWVLRQIGVRGTNNAAAKSFLLWGKELKEPVKGCIAVFTRDGGGHVAFVDHVAGDSVFCLGGNQGNKVCVAAYPKSRLLSYRGF